MTTRKDRAEQNFGKLPEHCFAHHPDDMRLIRIERGESGFWYVNQNVADRYDAAKLNWILSVSDEQAAAMITGSMWGWHVPGANPDNYQHVVPDTTH